MQTPSEHPSHEDSISIAVEDSPSFQTASPGLSTVPQTENHQSSMRAKSAESKNLFERECKLQKRLTKDLCQQLSAKIESTRQHMQRCSTLLDVIDTEDALWAQAIEMAGLDQQQQDTHFASTFQEAEQILETAVQPEFDKEDVINRIDDLIDKLQQL